MAIVFDNAMKTSLFVPTLLVSLLVFGACAGEPTFTATATPTATPTPRPTVLSLNRYLVLALLVETDLATNNTDLLNTFPDVRGDPEASRQWVVQYARTVDRTAKKGLGTLADVTPPHEAQAYHQTLLHLLRGFENLADDFGAAQQTQDSSRSVAAARGSFVLVQELFLLAKEGQHLVITALQAEPNDPLNAYLIAATAAQLELAPLLEDFPVKLAKASATAQKEGSANAIYDVVEELITGLERLEDEWLRLTPPAEAQELHQRRAELAGKQLDVNRRLLTAIGEQDEATQLEAPQLLSEVAAELGNFAADWNELLIKALSR